MICHPILAMPPVNRLARSICSLGIFSDGRKIVFSRAPGRLDVMGGIADYSGSLVCEIPLNIAAGAAVQIRLDKRLVCHSAQKNSAIDTSIDRLCTNDPADVQKLFTDSDDWARYVAGCLWWVLQKLPDCPGLSIAIDSDVPLNSGLSSSAAVEVAVMTAICEIVGLSFPPMQLAAACQEVENRIVGAPCGVMDQATASLGRQDSLLLLLCQPDDTGSPAQVVSHIKLPKGFKFVAINSGVRHEVKGDPYTDTRIAAFMGQKILSQLEQVDLTRGYLANVDDLRFRNELAAKLPLTITGEDFIDQYGYTNDPVTTIDPARQYHVRAATAHHVFESCRAEHFAELLKRSSQLTGEFKITTIRELGQLMYYSHESYSKNAGLGHECTDRLVDMVAVRGHDKGFYGAKITGGGSGGTVAVLIRDDEQVNEQLEVIRNQYSQMTGRSTMMFDRTGNGAAVTGSACINFEDLLCAQPTPSP